MPKIDETVAPADKTFTSVTLRVPTALAKQIDVYRHANLIDKRADAYLDILAKGATDLPKASAL